MVFLSTSTINATISALVVPAYGVAVGNGACGLFDIFLDAFNGFLAKSKSM